MDDIFPSADVETSLIERGIATGGAPHYLLDPSTSSHDQLLRGGEAAWRNFDEASIARFARSPRQATRAPPAPAPAAHADEATQPISLPATVAEEAAGAAAASQAETLPSLAVALTSPPRGHAPSRPHATVASVEVVEVELEQEAAGAPALVHAVAPAGLPGVLRADPLPAWMITFLRGAGHVLHMPAVLLPPVRAGGGTLTSISSSATAASFALAADEGPEASRMAVLLLGTVDARGIRGPMVLIRSEPGKEGFPPISRPGEGAGAGASPAPRPRAAPVELPRETDSRPPAKRGRGRGREGGGAGAGGRRSPQCAVEQEVAVAARERAQPPYLAAAKIEVESEYSKRAGPGYLATAGRPKYQDDLLPLPVARPGDEERAAKRLRAVWGVPPGEGAGQLRS
jgi:hypothetical protein